MQPENPSHRFDRLRPRLQGIAYRILVQRNPDKLARIGAALGG